MSMQPKKPEDSNNTPLWKHPYWLYIILTTVLFLFLLVMAWLAQENDWIPRR